MTCILGDVWLISAATVDEFYICMLFEFWCEDVASISWIFILFACIIALIEIGCYNLHKNGDIQCKHLNIIVLFSCRNNLRYKHQQYQTNDLKLKKVFYMRVHGCSHTHIVWLQLPFFDMICWQDPFARNSTTNNVFSLILQNTIHRGWICS